MPDYVLMQNVEKNRMPNAQSETVEPTDMVYAAESIVELINDGFRLLEGEQFVRLDDLPDNIRKFYPPYP
jgi:phage gp29-like protein